MSNRSRNRPDYDEEDAIVDGVLRGLKILGAGVPILAVGLITAGVSHKISDCLSDDKSAPTSPVADPTTPLEPQLIDDNAHVYMPPYLDPFIVEQSANSATQLPTYTLKSTDGTFELTTR